MSEMNISKQLIGLMNIQMKLTFRTSQNRYNRI